MDVKFEDNTLYVYGSDDNHIAKFRLVERPPYGEMLRGIRLVVEIVTDREVSAYEVQDVLV